MQQSRSKGSSFPATCDYGFCHQMHKHLVTQRLCINVGLIWISEHLAGKRDGSDHQRAIIDIYLPVFEDHILLS